MAKQKPTQADKSRIPICQTEFLQDVSIELGRRLKAVRYRTRPGKLEFSVTVENNEGLSVERFEAINWSWKNGSYIQVVAWEDREALYVYREPFENKQDRARYKRFRIKLKGWTAYEFADLLRNSLLDDVDIRDLWKSLSVRE